MKRGFSLTVKLVLVGLAFTVPIGALLAFLVNEKTKAIHVAEDEIAGIEMIRPLSQMIYWTSQHQILTLGASLYKDDEAIANSLASATNNVNQSLREIETTYQSESFQAFLKEIEQSGMSRPESPASYLRSAWEETQRQIQTVDTNSLGNAYKNLLDRSLEAVGEFANVSGLVLDPDLDSYHTMLAFTEALPTSQLAYLTMINQVMLALGKEQSTEALIRASVHKGLTLHYNQKVETLISEAQKGDLSSYGRNESLNSDVPDKQKRYQESLEAAMRELAPDRMQGPRNPTNLSLWLSPLDKSFELSKSLTKTTEQLLNTRIQNVQEKRAEAVLYVLLCWLGASSLGYFLQRSVVLPIKKILRELNDISADTRQTSTKLHASAQRSAAAATEEATAIQETVAAMEEMTSMLAQTAIHTRNASDVAQDVLDKTRSGTQTMENMARSMDTIANANTRLNEITKIIEDITSKTNVINDIVFKTQLLAVNASIEAARAGHHGKGFAVVANEVANLANMSGKAATDIRHLLNESRLQVSHILESTADSVRNGQTVCNEALETFDTISKAITSISEKVDQINEATREQETGVKQTSTAMTNINQATISNNEASQDNAIMAERLKTQANRLIRVGRAMNFVVLGEEKTQETVRSSPHSNLDQILGDSREVSPDESSEEASLELGTEEESDTSHSKRELARRLIKKVKKDEDDLRKSA